MTLRDSSPPDNRNSRSNRLTKGWMLVAILIVLSAVSLTTLAWTGSVEAATAILTPLLLVVGVRQE
jgi:hypothetical protein